MPGNGWVETAQNLRKPIPETADSLRESLSELSDVMCIHFEELVAKRVSNDHLPKCVDCMARHRQRMYLIEFKPLPSEDAHDIPESLSMKVLESAMVYRRFLAEDFGDLELGFILVVQDRRAEYVSSLQRRAGLDSSGKLSRYGKRDIDGNVMFYGTMEMFGVGDFIRIAKNRFGRPGA